MGFDGIKMFEWLSGEYYLIDPQGTLKQERLQVAKHTEKERERETRESLIC